MAMAVLPRLLAMVRHDPAREAASAAAFGLAQLDRRLATGDRAEIRLAFGERWERAVGHDRAALSELLRRLEAPSLDLQVNCKVSSA